jgi:hypothetical protein
MACDVDENDRQRASVPMPGHSQLIPQMGSPFLELRHTRASYKGNSAFSSASALGRKRSCDRHALDNEAVDGRSDSDRPAMTGSSASGQKRTVVASIDQARTGRSKCRESSRIFVGEIIAAEHLRDSPGKSRVSPICCEAREGRRRHSPKSFRNLFLRDDPITDALIENI